MWCHSSIDQQWGHLEPCEDSLEGFTVVFYMRRPKWDKDRVPIPTERTQDPKREEKLSEKNKGKRFDFTGMLYKSCALYVD